MNTLIWNCRKCFAMACVSGLLGLFSAALNAATVAGHATATSDNPSAPSSANGPGYSIDLSQALTHYITITMTVEAEGEETQLMMPTWTPGSYLVREYARHIDQISAADSSGEPLAISKIKKNRWLVRNGGAKKFTVTYRLFCKEPSVRTNFVDVNHAVLTGAATFLTVPEQMALPHTVKLVLPKKWTESQTSLEPVGRRPHNYRAANFDELVDSPIVAGNVITYPFEVNGVPHYLVNVNQAGNWNAEQAVEDLTKIVAAHHKLWGVIPYDRYYFLNVFGNGGGGLEHDNSCLLMTSRFDVRDEQRYLGWLGLCSHELFHAWNIRRLRPKSLVAYDYENEAYTPSLWIAEGLTSYYEDLLVTRAGILSEEQWLENLGRSINSLQTTEGRLVQSLNDSSHDAWIKFYRPAPNTSDTQISYYTKGAVVGFLLDMEIRSATNGNRSLDDVLRIFYERHQQPVGYELTDFYAVCQEVAGRDLNPWFERAVNSTEELDYQTAANWLGISIGEFAPQSDAEAPAKPKSSRTTSRRTPARWIGIGKPDSPATKAGLSDSDEIIAINKVRVSSVDTELQKYQAGEPVAITIARAGVLEDVLVIVGSRPETGSWELKRVKKPTDDQTKNWNRWLSAEDESPAEPAEVQAAAEAEANQPEDEMEEEGDDDDGDDDDDKESGSDRR